jgi:hypothetical protein
MALTKNISSDKNGLSRNHLPSSPNRLSNLTLVAIERRKSATASRKRIEQSAYLSIGKV